jgi:preprotein translocase subunit SecA
MDGEHDPHCRFCGTSAHSQPARLPKVRAEPKIGRNQPCPCGSGTKYKKCCGR